MDETEQNAKPAERKAERTRAALCVAARQAFAEHGWSGTRVKTITDIAQVSHATFYTYYENREAVLEDLISEVITPLAQLVDAPWRGSNPTDGLYSLIEAFVDVHIDSADIMAIWQQAASQQPAFATSWNRVHEAFQCRIIQRLEGLSRLFADGEPDHIGDITDIVEILMAMVTSHRLATSAGERERLRLIDALMVIWGGTINQLLGKEVIGWPAEVHPRTTSTMTATTHPSDDPDTANEPSADDQPDGRDVGDIRPEGHCQKALLNEIPQDPA